MKMEVEVPDYSPEQGLQLDWDDNCTIEVRVQNHEVAIIADRAGLVSLARHLLGLAQPGVPPGSHFHLDDYTGLEENACSLIIERAKD
jgi:hypothetical protein